MLRCVLEVVLTVAGLPYAAGARRDLHHLFMQGRLLASQFAPSHVLVNCSKSSEAAPAPLGRSAIQTPTCDSAKNLRTLVRCRITW